jgi:hypothetical protein
MHGIYEYYPSKQGTLKSMNATFTILNGKGVFHYLAHRCMEQLQRNEVLPYLLVLEDFQVLCTSEQLHVHLYD